MPLKLGEIPRSSISTSLIQPDLHLLIWGRDRSKFGALEQTYRNKRVCETGKISDYKGIPEIIASEPSQIKLQ